MDRSRLIARLRQSAGRHAARTPFCPDDVDIAGFVDGSLGATAQRHIRHHLADCPVCVGRVGLLTRLLREQPEREHRSNADTGGRQWQREAPKWAVAASIFIAMGYLIGTSSFNFGDRTAIEYRETRSLDSRISPPEVLAPSSGIVGHHDALSVRWTDVPSALYYEVRVVSDTGDFVGVKRLTGTEWAIGRDLDLEPEREYFLRVDAFLTDAKPISSPFVPIMVRE